ncbi:RHS repeat domain-containing protein [Pseudomonas viridiflava]
MNGTLHQHTPVLDAFDSRGLRVRHVSLHRAQATDEAVARITAQRFNLAGQMIAAVDPRLGGAAQAANSTHVFSLTGQTLLTDSVDAGWRLVLFGEANQMLNSWDGRCLERRADYNDLLRPIAITEQGRVVERFGYGAADASEHNQCNQVIRHDDAAGSSFVTNYGMSGAVLDEARSFLLEPVSPDWPLADPVRDGLLEVDRLHTRRTVNALGEVLEQTDVCGNVQQFHQTVAGQLKSVELTHSDITQTLVSDLRYNAFNQVEQETAGNGVISRYAYDPHTGRLNELLATSADGVTVQKLTYAYDPIGNVLEIQDAAQLNRYGNNPRVDPVSHYTYDTLYQLIEAKGFEVKTGFSQGPGLPGMQNLPPDPNQVSNYTQTYDYDAAGNLLTMRHIGEQSFTRTMLVASDSNRSLPKGEVDTDFADSFDANGNLQQLVRGQSLSWNARNQLHQITTVQRESGLSDQERYIYDSQGQRVRKINSAQASGRTLINEVRYLPGLEIRTTADGEILHVITAQAGRNYVRGLHWEAGKPDGITNDQVRYSLTDHLGSSTLELDQQGGLISQESYYPFGGTAWWAARSAVEAKYKTVRYSGKERDPSGLYYYGLRYYAPWLQRWINPDPAGDVDGLNLFRFVSNAPTVFKDKTGLVGGQTNGAFFDNRLEERLIKQIDEKLETYAFISENYEHTLVNHTIISERQDIETNTGDYFENDFEPHEWRFKYSFRPLETMFKTYASDITLYQYATVADANNFMGELPSTIKIKNVENEGVLKVVDDYKDNPEMLQTAFLTDTQNGKSAQRIMNDFGLTATSVKAVFSDEGNLDVHIHVEPEQLLPELAQPTSAGLSAAPLSRLTVTPVSSSRPKLVPTILKPAPHSRDRRRSRSATSERVSDVRQLHGSGRRQSR